MFGEKPANHTFLGTAEYDLCSFCTSGVKNPRHPRVCLLFFPLSFFSFLLPVVTGGKQREARGLAALQEPVDQQTCIT